MLNLIPVPASLQINPGEFKFLSSTIIRIDTTEEEVKKLADYLSAKLQQVTGWQLPVISGIQAAGGICIELDQNPDLGEEGYELIISPDDIQLCAHQPAGLFYAIQTLLQMLPPSPAGVGQPFPGSQDIPISLPAVFIRDIPRFTWRGAMLDVARHFFGVEDVKRYIDLISHYKINRLHLHLSDDQGWRIEIKSWPRLTEVGGSTQVGGGKGGYYTQEQYKEIVHYAASRFMMIVPEIDTPGHTNAALASYAELNESEEAPALYEGAKVGFSTLWINSEITYKFLNDVIGELAALTPAPYIHIGGDEAQATLKEDYQKFIKRIQEIVASHGKTAVGWSEIGEAELLPDTIVQHWFGSYYQGAHQQGAKFIISPANKVYLDMKYDPSTPLGLDWAGLISVKDSYDWEPGSYMELLEEKDIIGLEAPLWTETVLTMQDIEYMAFPRLIGVAELAWSPKGQVWEEYRQRLAAHCKRMEALGINFYRSPDVDW